VGSFFYSCNTITLTRDLDLQSLKKMAFVSRLPLWIPQVSETTSTIVSRSSSRVELVTLAYCVFTVSRKSSVTSNANTMIFWQKNLALFVTLVSGTIVCTPCSTSSPPLAMRMCRHLYFLFRTLTCSFPSRKSLREMDIELMRRLSPRVNVIPVVGKADSLTPSELRGFKKRVRSSCSH